MFGDRLTRFLEFSAKEEAAISKPVSSKASLASNPTHCILFQRYCNLDDMETEDDEKYIFSTFDGSIKETFSRFEARIILSKLTPKLNAEKIEIIVKMAWNFPQIIINRKTGEYEPYANPEVYSLPPMNIGGYPPKRTVYLE